MDWINIISNVIIPILGIIITAIVIPWLRETRAWKYVQIAVKAAEQIFGAGTGDEKYQYVAQLLVSKFHLSEAEAKRLIEAAVKELDQVHIELGKEATEGLGVDPADGIEAEPGSKEQEA